MNEDTYSTIPSSNSRWKCPHPNCGIFTAYRNRDKHELTHSGPIRCIACEETQPNQLKMERHQGKCVGPISPPIGFPLGFRRKNNGHVVFPLEYCRYVQRRVMTQRATGENRIVGDFTGIYDCLQNLHNVPLDYGGFLVSPHPLYRVPWIALESLRYSDLHGEGPTFDTQDTTMSSKSQSCYMQDPSIDTCLQFRGQDLVRSGTEHIHYASAANHRKDYETLSKTYFHTNLGIGTRKLNNGPLKLGEEFCRERVRESGSGLIKTFSVFGDDDRIEPPKDNLPYFVGVPKAVGKININRFRRGLELWSWRFPYEANSCEPLTRFEWDPYDLMYEAGLSDQFTAPRSIFRKINGVSQPNWIDNPNVFPLREVVLPFPVEHQE